MSRSLTPALYGAVLLALVGVPMVWSLWGAAVAGTDTAGWVRLSQDPQFWPSLGMSVGTALTATTLALAASAWIVSRSFGQTVWPRWAQRLPSLLAVPHAAFAIGFVALLAPSGWVLRALSPWATGLQSPPAWASTQDPWGVGLVAVLVLKEIPFLLWTAMAYLQQPDVARRLQAELRLAHTMGYAPHRAWWCVVWPQLMPRLALPVLAVWAYGLTVVDMALVAGPTSPPTLAVLAWQWLQDAAPETQAQGAAAAWALAGCVALGAALLWWGARLSVWKRLWTAGVPAYHAQPTPTRTGAWQLHVLTAVYAVVLLALAIGSVSGYWPFPSLWPHSLSTAAWASVLGSASTLGTTVALALVSAGTALVWAVLWLEFAPPAWHQRAQPLLFMPLVLPAVLWVLGLHRLALAWDWDAQASGLWLAHSLASLPYVVLALAGPYAGFDARLGQLSATLGRSRWAYLSQVKWPLLKATLASAFAIGFAVSVAQYLPTLYVGAGRFSTVSTEAVNLAAGGQRSLTAAYAGLQWVLPVALFTVAHWLGRARTFRTNAMANPAQ
ncbi:ABC transporter permease [Rhodoferax aquaticus]|uniref:ABC transporter permease n=1 Tax=Rhodoferax aquaticus TaxID=2527691 RepID=A0A515ESR6_9BURK|nr:ABC transporter permease [Rhodoferax aquaticus]QDL55712.1 ABC transporter permease [Rhodoferax aquaticus]